jgi:5'-nucleotidase
MNDGGLRADLTPGPITWGDVLTLHPFGNRILKVTMTGAQLLQVLEEQWSADPAAIPRVLKTSGLYYQWDPAQPSGAHVVLACDARHRPIRNTGIYHVAVNDFLVGGGDDFTGFGGLPIEQVGPLDSEALDSYLHSLHGAITLPAGPRIFVTGGPQLNCAGAAPIQPTSSP